MLNAEDGGQRVAESHAYIWVEFIVSEKHVVPVCNCCVAYVKNAFIHGFDDIVEASFVSVNVSV